MAAAAAALDVRDGTIRSARLVLGGVAHKPWRSQDAEDALVGARPERSTFEAAADIALKDARRDGASAYKVPMTREMAIRALTQAASRAEAIA